MASIKTYLFFSAIVLSCQKSPSHTSECSPGPYGIPVFDALHGSSTLSSPFFETSIDVWNDENWVSALAVRLSRALRADPNELSPRSRIALQGDVWGLLQRVNRSAYSVPGTQKVLLAAKTLVKRLALLPEVAQKYSMSNKVPSVLPGDFDWQEMDNERPVLLHERLFDLRRVFRIFHAPGREALVSHLVGLNTDGVPYISSIVGDIEILDMTTTPPQGVMVQHLDRRALRCVEGKQKLKSLDAIEHVPGLGANAMFVQFDSPVALAENPCSQCHQNEDHTLSFIGSPQKRIELVLSDIKKELEATDLAN